jgi:hypothetical protein
VADLLHDAELPGGFAYPSLIVRIVDLGLTNLEPWWILKETRCAIAWRAPREPGTHLRSWVRLLLAPTKLAKNPP